MKPYPAYKASGISWLGPIPAQWEVRRTKYLLREIDIRSLSVPDQLLSVSQYTGVSLNKSSEDEKPLSLEGYRKCWPGDLVVNIMLAWMGAFGITHHQGVVSPAYCVYRLHSGLEPHYFDYLYHTPLYLAEIARNSRGIVPSRWRLYTEDFYRIATLCPPPDEQSAIVAYLDHKTADIERFITKKRQLIALLNDQKDAIINQAVTKGLNPDAPRKASGVDWLGEVPAHWKMRRLRFLATLNPSKTPQVSKSSLEQQVVFLPMENISVEGKIDNGTKKLISEVSSGFTFFGRGDVIIAKITPCFENGKGAWLDSLETDIGFGTTELIVLRPHDGVWAQFLYFVTASSAFRTQGEAVMTGSAGQQRVPTDFVKDYPVALPPLSEQKKITTFIEAEKAKVDEAINRIEREIELIREYRMTLISDAVTGKIDVREAVDAKNPAANLTT